MVIDVVNVLLTLSMAWCIAYVGFFVLSFGGSSWCSAIAIISDYIESLYCNRLILRPQATDTPHLDVSIWYGKSFTRWLKLQLQQLGAEVDLNQLTSLGKDKEKLAENSENWTQ